MRPMQTGPARRPRRRLPPLSAALLERLCGAAGPGGWIAEPSAMAPYLAEQRGLYESRADLVLRPDSTARVAAVMTIAADAGIAVVPQGGNTGLVGATVADGGIILSSDRMTRIRALDPVDMTMTVDAGCILADLQSAAEEAGVFFPLSLGAEGSCRIGVQTSSRGLPQGVLVAHKSPPFRGKGKPYVAHGHPAVIGIALVHGFHIAPVGVGEVRME